MRKKIQLFLAVLLITVSISACAHFEPAPYVNPNETMPGPGLFSGESGEYILINKDPDKTLTQSK